MCVDVYCVLFERIDPGSDVVAASTSAVGADEVFSKTKASFAIYTRSVPDVETQDAPVVDGGLDDFLLSTDDIDLDQVIIDRDDPFGRCTCRGELSAGGAQILFPLAPLLHQVVRSYRAKTSTSSMVGDR